MQKPLSLPLATPLPLNCIMQALQNLYVEMISNTLSRRYEQMVHQTINVKEFRELFDWASNRNEYQKHKNNNVSVEYSAAGA
jgi:hypothetical protein